MNQTAIFMIKEVDGPKALLIRHRCVSCVRKVAAEGSPAEEFDLWSDKSKSIITLPKTIPADVSADGKHGILARFE